MAVAYKGIGAVGSTTTTTLTVPVPALAVGDYAVMVVFAQGAASQPAGWSLAPGSPAQDGPARMHVYWKYADAAASASSETLTVAAGGGIGQVVVHTGAGDTAPSFTSNAQTTAAAYFRTAELTITEPTHLTSFGLIYAGRAFSATTTEGTISVTQTVRDWGTVLGAITWSATTLDATSAAGGRARTNFSGGNATSFVVTVAIPEVGDDPEPPGPANLGTYWDGTTEHPLDATTTTYWDGEQEVGFSYPNGRTGPAAHALSYWDGTTEHPLDATPPDGRGTIVEGMSYIAHGDSSGALQTSGGVDYTASQTWPHQLAGHLGTTCTNRHVSSSTAFDVFERLNKSTDAARWIPGSADFVTVFVGGNDLVHTHTQAGGQRAYKNSMMSIAGLLRMDTRVLASAGTETGTWSTGSNGSGGVRSTTGAGATTTLTFTGTDAMLTVLAPRTGAGADYEISVDGGPPISDTTTASGATAVLAGSWVPVPHYMRGLTAGTHTVVATRTGGTGPLVIDSIIVLKPESNGPRVLWGPIIDGEDIWELAGTPPYPTPQTVATFRQLQREALVEAGVTRQAIMLADRWQRVLFNDLTGLVINDNYHFNREGHERAGAIAATDARHAWPASPS